MDHAFILQRICVESRTCFLYNSTMKKLTEYIKTKYSEKTSRLRWCLIWIRNALRFEIIYRLLMILAVHPLINWLINHYITSTTYHSSLANYNILFDFMTVQGLITLFIVMIISVSVILFETLTLCAMTICMIEKKEYTTSNLYATAFGRLRILLHPSIFLAPLYFLGLLPLTHIGYVSSYLSTIQVPRFITGELSMTWSGQLIVFGFFMLAFILFAILVFVPILLLTRKISFFKACRESIRLIRGMEKKYYFKLAAVILSLFFLNYALLQLLPAPALKNSDFNIYLFRYFFHSYYFRIQLGSTILYWLYLFAASMFFLYFTLRLFLSQGQQPDLALKESDQPFFALRISAYVKQTALSLKNKCLQRFIASPHKKMLILLLCPFMIVTMALYLDQEPLMHRPWVIGHRGDSHAPENSLEGVRSAALHGADFAEIDIQLTADQQLAVFHDNTTSRLAHENLTVKTSTMKELQQLVLFDRDQEFRIPSLQEAVACAKQQRSSFGLLIELKPQPGQAEKMVKQLIRIIERYDFEERAIFMSMDYEAVQYLKELRPQWWCGYCIFGALGKIDYKLNVNFLAIEESQANTRFLEQARNNGIPIYVWTVDDRYSILTYLRKGVSGIIGNSVEDIRDSVDDYLVHEGGDYVYDGDGYPLI